MPTSTVSAAKLNTVGFSWHSEGSLEVAVVPADLQQSGGINRCWAFVHRVSFWRADSHRGAAGGQAMKLNESVCLSRGARMSNVVRQWVQSIKKLLARDLLGSHQSVEWWQFQLFSWISPESPASPDPFRRQPRASTPEFASRTLPRDPLTRGLWASGTRSLILRTFTPSSSLIPAGTEHLKLTPQQNQLQDKLRRGRRSPHGDFTWNPSLR